MFVIGFVFIQLSFMSGCWIDSDSEDLPENPENFPTQMAGEEMIYYGYNNDGSLDFIVRGTNDYYLQTKEFLLTDFKVLYYGKDEEGNEVITQLTSNYGKIHTITKNFQAWGNVIVIKKDDSRISTSQITYDHKDKMLRTPPNNKVIIYRADGTITEGVDLVASREASTDAGKIELKDSITYTPNTIEKSEDTL